MGNDKSSRKRRKSQPSSPSNHDEDSDMDTTNASSSKTSSKKPLTMMEAIGLIIYSQQQMLKQFKHAANNKQKEVVTQECNATIKLAEQLKESLESEEDPITKNDVLSIVSECLRKELAAFKPPQQHASSSRSYANAAAAGNNAFQKNNERESQTQQKSRPAIIIASSDVSKTSSDVMKDFRKHVSFRNAGFAPVKMHPVSKDKVRVEFESREHQETALQKVTAAGNGLVAEKGRLRRPLMILKGISEEIPADEAIAIIKSQNEGIAIAIDHGSDVTKKFVRKNRREGLYNLVIEVSPKVRKAIVDKGRVNIELQRIHAEDFSSFTQCFKCLQFGHIQSKCESVVKPCSHCGTVEHQIRECPHKDDPTKLSCYNCVVAQIKNGKTYPTNHTCTSTAECPIVRRMMQRVNAQPDYGC